MMRPANFSFPMPKWTLRRKTLVNKFFLRTAANRATITARPAAICFRAAAKSLPAAQNYRVTRIIRRTCACSIQNDDQDPVRLRDAVSFEVEPQNGLMPYTVNCPSCNADGTAAANQIIAQTPRLRMQTTAPAPPVTPPPPPDIPQPIPKPVASAKIQSSKPKRDRCESSGGLWPLCLLLVLALLGAWGWFSFVGSKPRLAFSMKLDGMASGWRTEFLPDGKIALASADHVIVRDLHNDRDLWSAALPGEAANNPRPPDVFVDQQSIWVCPGDKVIRLDQKTGEVKLTVPISGQLDSFTPTESSILVVSATDETSRVATRLTSPPAKFPARTSSPARAKTRHAG